MEPILTPEQMRKLEKAYMERTGTPSIQLMERAALAVARWAMELAGGPGRTAVFACGSGGNGGDGFAAARLYGQAGGRALVLPVYGEERLAPDAAVNCRLARTAPGVVFIAMEDLPRVGLPGLWVDAVFGIGLSRPLDQRCQDLFARMEADRLLGAPVLAVDIPSGLNGLTGAAFPGAVRASHTLTFQCLKAGHCLADGLDFCGQLRAASLDIPPELLPPDALVHVTPQDAQAQLVPRRRNCHKGQFGHLLVVAGSRGMAGAALMAAQAALRSGAGLVTVACPESALPVIQSGAPCAMALPLPEAEGALAQAAAPLLRRALEGKTAAAVGPGLSLRAHPDSVAAVLESPLPAVVDADALNLIAQSPALKGLLAPRHLITPHPGEAARLLGGTAQGPLDALERLRALGPTVLYKGAATLTAGETGRYIRTSGCPGMAKGGSGDVLTGMLGALLAQGYPVERAAWMGAALHGLAGELAQSQWGHTAMTPWDMIEALPQVWTHG